MIGSQISVRAARAPQDPALVYERRRLSYGELNRRACRLANGLAALGIGRGDRVATLMYNATEFFEALFAVAKLGAIFVPLNFRLVAREIGLQLDGCTPRALIAGTSFRDVLAELAQRDSYPTLRLWVDEETGDTAAAGGPGGDRGDERAGGASYDGAYEPFVAAQPHDEPQVAVEPDDFLMLMHSSGTTGVPKGTIFSHATAHASCAAKIIDFGLTDRDVTVVFGPLFHAGPLMDLTLPLLLRGGTVVLGQSRRFDAARLLQAVAEHRVTVVPIYPTMLRRVLTVPADPALDLKSLRMIITGGEAAPVTVIRGVHDRFPWVDFVNNYGSTEGGPITTFLPPQLSRTKTGSVGRESFGVEVRIADATGRALPAGEVGEVLVRGPFVCRGYWNRPDETAASRVDGWWRTGDLGYRDGDGCLWIEGRRKDMIKSGTENIYPIEVEQVVVGLDGVEEVAVIGVPDDDWGESVAAFVVRSPDSAIDAERVIEHCRRHLASYKKPRHVVFVDALPRGATSKVSKLQLRAQWDATRGRGAPGATVAPGQPPGTGVDR